MGLIFGNTGKLNLLSFTQDGQKKTIYRGGSGKKKFIPMPKLEQLTRENRIALQQLGYKLISHRS